MAQRLQDTDVFILREFSNATKHLKGKLRTPEGLAEMQKIGPPFLQRLKNNDNTHNDAVGLMRDVFAL
jgi:hypothetical protein